MFEVFLGALIALFILAGIPIVFAIWIQAAKDWSNYKRYYGKDS